MKSDQPDVMSRLSIAVGIDETPLVDAGAAFVLDAAGCYIVDEAGDKLVIHLDDIAEIERAGTTLQIRVHTGRLVDFGNQRWDGRYPPIHCGAEIDADMILQALRRTRRRTPVKRRVALTSGDYTRPYGV